MLSHMKLKGAAVAVGTVLFIASAQAVHASPSVSLDLPTLDTFEVINQSGAGTPIDAFTRTESTSFGGIGFTDYTVNFDDEEVPVGGGFGSAHVGKESLGLDWTGFNEFVIQLRNQNENTGWEFSVTVEDGSGGVSSSAVQILPVVPDTGPFTTFSVDLTSLDVTDIDTIFFKVGGNLPLGSSDTTAEFAARPSAVPVPATLALFGAGLIGLGVLGRRFKTGV